jgi:hypothetical protein
MLLSEEMVGAIILYFDVFKSELISSEKLLFLKLVGPRLSENMFFLIMFVKLINSESLLKSELLLCAKFFVLFSEMLVVIDSEIMQVSIVVWRIELPVKLVCSEISIYAWWCLVLALFFLCGIEIGWGHLSRNSDIQGEFSRPYF